MKGSVCQSNITLKEHGKERHHGLFPRRKDPTALLPQSLEVYPWPGILFRGRLSADLSILCLLSRILHLLQGDRRILLLH